MPLIIRCLKIFATFVIFICAQTFLAASINSFFDLIPIKIERIFPQDHTEKSVEEIVVDVQEDKERKTRQKGIATTVSNYI